MSTGAVARKMFKVSNLAIAFHCCDRKDSLWCFSVHEILAVKDTREKSLELLDTA